MINKKRTLREHNFKRRVNSILGKYNIKDDPISCFNRLHNKLFKKKYRKLNIYSNLSILSAIITMGAFLYLLRDTIL